MIDKKVEKALNEQINAEFYSAYLYLSMSAYFDSINLPGCAHWMRAQYGEEIGHGMKFFKYITERGGKVTIKGFDNPPVTWASPLAVFKAAYAHEQKVTGFINKLVEIARAEKDNATEIFLQWFVMEQVEEEQNADSIINKLTIAKDSPNIMFMIDHELGARKSG